MPAICNRCLSVLPALLLLTLCACAEGSARASIDGPAPAVALPVELPAISGLDKLHAKPTGQRKVSDITHDLLAAAPLLSAPSFVNYSSGPPATLALSPPSDTRAWAICAVDGLPNDGSKFPLRVNVLADAGYYLLVSDYSSGRWRGLDYSAQGIYNLADGQNLVSPAGSFYVAALAWNTAPTFSGLTATTNEDVVNPGEPHELWYYEQTNLQVDANLTTAIEHLNTAAAAGYKAVLYADTKLEFIDQAIDTYLTNLAAYKAAADAAGIRIIPNMVSPGYANGLLIHDPNLVEGQPVVDAPFLVQNGFAGNFAGVIQNPSTEVTNGDFEAHNGDDFDNWNQIDGAGFSTFADANGHDGSQTCIRFESFASGINGNNDRIQQTVLVDPWQVYSVNFWVKTDSVAPVGQLWVRAFEAGNANRLLSFNTWPIQSTQDWTQYHLIFNSQELTSIWLYMGIWGGESGSFWIDDVSIQHAGLINLIRRPGAPFKVTNEDGTITYTEGVDFDAVKDDAMGVAEGYPGTYDLYHSSPLLQHIGGSIQIGDKLKVSYYTATFTDDLKPACALEEQKVYDIVGNVLGVINTQLNPDEIFIGVDEHRVAGWSQPGFGNSKTAGESLASFTQQVNTIAKGINPAWKIATWSDMYDPYHNAVADYYLCRGGMTAAAAGLPADWEVANWHFFDQDSVPDNDRALALQHFAGRGNRQILSGYYDDPAGYAATLNTWLDDAKGQTGTYAVMYTTWNGDFSKLAEFAQTVRDWETANP